MPPTPLLELGLGEARAQRADMDPCCAHFLMKRFGQTCHVCLRRCIYRKTWGRLKARHARHIEEVATPSLAHRPECGVADLGECFNVQVDFLSESAWVEIDKLSTRTETCVVDHQVDRDLGIADGPHHRSQAAFCSEVGLDHGETVVPMSDLLQAVDTARDQHRRNTGISQLLRHFGTDPGRGSGYEG